MQSESKANKRSTIEVVDVLNVRRLLKCPSNRMVGDYFRTNILNEFIVHDRVAAIAHRIVIFNYL